MRWNTDVRTCEWRRIYLSLFLSIKLSRNQCLTIRVVHFCGNRSASSKRIFWPTVVFLWPSVFRNEMNSSSKLTKLPTYQWIHRRLCLSCTVLSNLRPFAASSRPNAADSYWRHVESISLQRDFLDHCVQGGATLSHDLSISAHVTASICHNWSCWAIDQVNEYEMSKVLDWFRGEKQWTLTRSARHELCGLPSQVWLLQPKSSSECRSSNLHLYPVDDAATITKHTINGKRMTAIRDACAMCDKRFALSWQKRNFYGKTRDYSEIRNNHLFAVRLKRTKASWTDFEVFNFGNELLTFGWTFKL